MLPPPNVTPIWALRQARGSRLLVDETIELSTLHRHLESAGGRWANSFALGPEWGGGEVPFNVVLIGEPPTWTDED